MTVHESVDRDADKNAATTGATSSGSGPAQDSDAAGGASLLDAKSSQQKDAIFRGVTVAAGAVIVALIGMIGIVLVAQSVPSVMADQINFFTSSVTTVISPFILNYFIKKSQNSTEFM